MCLRNVRGVKGRTRFLCIDEESVLDMLSCVLPRESEHSQCFPLTFLRREDHAIQKVRESGTRLPDDIKDGIQAANHGDSANL